MKYEVIKNQIEKVCNSLKELKTECYINSFKSKLENAIIVLKAYQKTI